MGPDRLRQHPSLQNQQLDQTLPFSHLRHMLNGNRPTASAATTLVLGSTGVNDVILQLLTPGRGHTRTAPRSTVAISGGRRPRSAADPSLPTAAPLTPVDLCPASQR